MFPKRSGGEVVYLEQAYPRPRFFVPIVFAITTVLLSFVLILNPVRNFVDVSISLSLSAINAIVFAQYFLLLCGIPITSSSQTTTAIGAITAACLGRHILRMLKFTLIHSFHSCHLFDQMVTESRQLVDYSQGNLRRLVRV